jgi:hypothetical protein
MLPEALRLIIEKAVDKLVPLIFQKITSGEGIGSLPLAAFLDWRKAMPNAAAAASSAPAAPSVPTPAPTAPTPAPPPPAASAQAHAAPASTPASTYAPHGVTAPPPPPATAPAGAASSPASPLGAAPAEAAPATNSLTPQELTHEEAAAMLNAHILQIWQGLSPSERNRASELISALTDTQRNAWFAELARLSVPEAIARARAVLRAQPPPTPANTSLLTATHKGDPS